MNIQMKVNIEKILKTQAATIDEAIEKYIPRYFSEDALVFKLSNPQFTISFRALDKTIAEPIWEFLDRGGKRWRPSLFLLICEALGKDAGEFIEFATIPEVIHNGTLMIDDIEDNSKLRRGKPCTHRLYGLDVAINSGNAMYYLPLLTLINNQDRFPPTILKKAYNVYVQLMINLSFGQAMDIAWHRGLADAVNVSEEEYLQMCAYKTGTLARLSAQLAAILSGASDVLAERLGGFAESVGVAFQIQDDVLDLVGEEFTRKKGARGMDISEGKRTLIVVHTLQNATQADRKRIEKILNMHSSDQRLRDEAIAIMKKYDSIEYAKEYARRIVRQSWGKIENSLPASPAKERLKAFAEYLIEREI